MLNYVWAGLIIIAFLFAAGRDLTELWQGRYRNGDAIAVTLAGNEIRLAGSDIAGHFPEAKDAAPQAITFVIDSRDGDQVRLKVDALPEPLNTIRAFQENPDKTLRATLVQTAFDQKPSQSSGDTSDRPGGDASTEPVHGQSAGAIEPSSTTPSGGTYALRFEPVRFVKLRAITNAAIEMSQTAWNIAVSLIGGLALWCGLLKIADDSGLVNLLVKVVRPLLRPVFPDVPRDHPALALIAMNISANMLSLGNAATPIGIRAMQELQKLNPRKDTATNAMVMLLAINTAGVTLLPSPSLLAIMGARLGPLMVPIILTTSVALVIAVITARILEKFSPQPSPDPTEAHDGPVA
jgi:spore maturation protein A